MKKQFIFSSLLLFSLLGITNQSFALFTVQKKTILQFGDDCYYWIHEYTYSGQGFQGVGQPIDWGYIVAMDVVSEPAGIKIPCGSLINYEDSEPENLPAEVADVYFHWVVSANGTVTDLSFTIVNDYTADGSAATYLNARKQNFIDAMNNQVLYQHPETTIVME